MLEIVSETKLRFGIIFNPPSVVNQIIDFHRYRDLCLAGTIKPLTQFKCSFTKKIVQDIAHASLIRPSGAPLLTPSDNFFNVLYEQRSSTSLYDTNSLILIKSADTTDFHKISVSTTKFPISGIKYPPMI